MADAERYQHYEVLRREDGSLWELGRGAMGITYKAFDTSLRCPVALKVINNSYLNSEVARQRFLREARAAASLRHQNVASVFHLGTDHDSYFYAMEFIDGETLDACIKRKGLLDPAEALGIVLQVSRALAAADKERLVHRDLKPSNLMLVEEDDEKVVKVIDFGLAKSTQRGGDSSGTLTVGGGFVGTPHFASPEQLEEREIDIRSDIYSLGATLYYMLAGRPPYAGSVAQIMSQHLYKPIPREPLDSLPPCVVDLIQRMMEKDPAKRPQHPADLRREILPCLGRLQGGVTGGSSAAAVANAGEQADTLATLDLSSAGSGAAGSGTLLAQRYRIISDLGDVPHGRRFLAYDLRRARPVSVLLLSLEFVSDSKRYTALEQEIERLHRTPNPLLRQVYSLESAAQQNILVEEHVIGPSLLEVLRARSFLSPPETWLLLNLLAPIADHAQANELKQVDITLSGVQLISPRLTETWAESDILRQPLTRWDQLGVKVAAVDFSLSASDPTNWVGAATLTQMVSGGGARASYLRALSLLVYELLGGPRNGFESTGRYSPVSSLSAQGNVFLRRGLIDDFRSATEMALQLGGEIVAGNIDPVTTVPVPASSPGWTSVNLPSGAAIPPSVPVSQIESAGQPPVAISSNREKTRPSATKLLPFLFLVAAIGLGGYIAYLFFFMVPGARKGQGTTVRENLLTQSSTPAAGGTSTTPSRMALASPGAKASTSANRAALPGPSAEARATPDRAVFGNPSVEARATSNRATLSSPSAEARATPDREARTNPSVAASTTPSRADLAGPIAEVSATPSPAVIAIPRAEVSATPSRVVQSSPRAEISATPSRVVQSSPNVEISATPSRVAQSSEEASATPSRVVQSSPSVEISATPSRAAQSSEEASATPSRMAQSSPSVEISATPSRVAQSSEEASTTPSRVVQTSPSVEISATPNGAAQSSPSVEASTTPSRAAQNRASVDAGVLPDHTALVSPSPEVGVLAKLEPLATPDDRMASFQSQSSRHSSAPDDYPERLAAAQRLIDFNDRPGALKAYLELIERYPDRPAASRSLENYLTDWSSNERRLDPESFAQMKPDLVRAAEDGVLQAMLIVGRSSQETDRATALRWFQAAASKGSVEGMKKAGDLIYSNHQRPDDDAKALGYFVQAASTGDPDAEYLVGECYFFGKGTTPDVDKAIQFLQLAADRRYPKAMDLLGTCYRKQRNFEQARRFYEEGAAGGYALSYYNLGVLFMNGEGVTRNPKKAEELFRQSAELFKQNAERGQLIPMFYYANWLERGIGVPKDPKAASEWFRRAARGGYPPALDWCKRNDVVP